MILNTVCKRNKDTYAEIDLKALRKNFEILRKEVNRDKNHSVKVCSIVKANAYGHGMFGVSEALVKFGTEYLGTADYFESIKLSDHLKKTFPKKIPVLCLGNLTDESLFPEIISRDIDITIADLKMASRLNDYSRSQNKKVNVQIQVDTGINRIGILIKDAYQAIKEIEKFKNVNVKGIYSHFATSEVPKNSYAIKQLKNFESLIRDLEQTGIKFELKHISNSGGILNYHNNFFNMVRPGISLYGYYPDRKKLTKDIGIKPVMSVKTKVKFLKSLDKSESISYGRKYFTKHKTKIASLPIGYGDGYSRLFTNKSSVVINGKRYRTVGAICMDWTMAELGKNSNVKINDEVIVFGKEYPAYNLSEIMGTIPYEITCSVSSRVKRIYTEI